MKYTELLNEQRNYRAELKAGHIELVKGIESNIKKLSKAIDKATKATNVTQQRADLIEILLTSEASKDACQTHFDQWVAMVEARGKTSLVAEAMLSLTYPTCGQSIMSKYGETTYYKLLRSVHAACIGSLNSGLSGADKTSFSNESIAMSVLESFCMAVNSKAYDEYLANQQVSSVVIPEMREALAMLQSVKDPFVMYEQNKAKAQQAKAEAETEAKRKQDDFARRVGAEHLIK